MKTKFLPLLLCVSATSVWGQETINPTDSVLITASKIEKLSIGHQRIVLKNPSNDGLTQLLSEQTSAYLKEYGNGMLSSISFRGLGAAHTAVFWEGIPVNSQLNGQCDFNLLNPDGFNQIELRTGAGGATWGSGAVGGSVHLNSKMTYNQGLKWDISQKIASFDTYKTFLNVDYSDARTSVQASLSRFSSDNDYDYEKNDGTEATVENGAMKQLGSNITIEERLGEHNRLKISSLMNFYNRNLVEMEGTNYLQHQKDKSYNLNTQWLYQNKKYEQRLSLAYLYADYQYTFDRTHPFYTGGTTRDYIAQYEGQYQWNDAITLGTNLMEQATHGEGDNFGEHNLNQVFLNAYIKLKGKHFLQSLTLAQNFSNQFDIPLGVDYGLEWTNKNFGIKGSFATAYRTPTFNDLYWTTSAYTSGNPDLKVEKGWNSELGATYHATIQSTDIQFSATGFYGKFNDWIAWMPNATGVYVPININNVENYGIECFGAVTLPISHGFIQWNMNYAYNHSTDTDTDKKLVYTPVHKINNSINLQYQKWYVGLHHQFTDEIYTNADNSQHLSSFHLFNAKTGYKISHFSFETGVKNLFDTSYHVVKDMPMPMRNYYVQFAVHF